MKADRVRVIESSRIPERPEPGVVYRLMPEPTPNGYYEARTDRHIGWITREEQQLLKTKIIGIAGCGGMGGTLAQIFFRQGIGEVRIADPEVFDVSNLNRQFAATRATVGKSKAMETARVTRAILDDNTLAVYPQGICEEAVDHFLAGCDVVCDEIEFWAVAARILLHRQARNLGVSIFNCNTVGVGSRLFLFEPGGFTMENLLGMDYEEAKYLQKCLVQNTATETEVAKVMKAVITGLIPEMPEYCSEDSGFLNVPACLQRLKQERKAPILGTNPWLASGFLADHVLFYLLRESPVKRNIRRPPPAPGYLCIDAFKDARVVNRGNPVPEKLLEEVFGG